MTINGYKAYYLSIDHPSDRDHAPVEKVYAKSKAEARKKAADIYWNNTGERFYNSGCKITWRDESEYYCGSFA